MMALKVLGLAVLLSLSGELWADTLESARLDNWHQWRGPNASGVATHGDPPVHWDESTNIKWKVEIPGKGSATPVVWEDRIFILTAIDTGLQSVIQEKVIQENAPTEQVQPKTLTPSESQTERSRGFGRRMTRQVSTIYEFVILCLDKQTGAVRWKQVANQEVPHEGGHLTNTYASASPTTDGKYLYVSFGSRGIYCYSLDGELIWKRDLGDMQTRRGFGEGASPVVHGDRLIVNWDHEGDSFITCLDATTGADRWKTERDEVTTWATPLIVKHGMLMQVITNGTIRSRGYNLESGKQIWECGGQATNPIASPVVHDGLVFCMTGHHGYALNAIPLDATGDITGTDEIVWTRDRGTSYIASPLLYNGLLYFTKSRTGILSCVEAQTGKEVYTDKRLLGIETIYASLASAGGKIFIVGRDGTTVVVKSGPNFTVLATNRLDEGIDASPVIVGDKLFLRSSQHLYCISEE
jgi:outer membrane protein assembly factor BamB